MRRRARRRRERKLARQLERRSMVVPQLAEDQLVADLEIDLELLDLGDQDLEAYDNLDSDEEALHPQLLAASLRHRSNLVASVAVRDERRFSRHLSKVQLRNEWLPQAPAAAPPADVDADESEKFATTSTRLFNDAAFVAQAVCAARPDGVTFHGTWRPAGPTSGSKTKAFNDSGDDARNGIRAWFQEEFGLTLTNFGSSKATTIVDNRIKKDVDYAQQWSVLQCTAWDKFKPRTSNKQKGVVNCLYCKLCFVRLTEKECAEKSAKYFLENWHSVVVVEFGYRKVEHPDDNNHTVRMSCDIKKVYFHDCQCSVPVGDRTYTKAREMYFGGGGAIRLPISRRNLFIGNMFDSILNGLDDAGPHPVGFEKELSGLVANPFSDHHVMNLPSPQIHPRYFPSRESYQKHQLQTQQLMVRVMYKIATALGLSGQVSEARSVQSWYKTPPKKTDPTDDDLFQAKKEKCWNNTHLFMDSPILEILGNINEDLNRVIHQRSQC